MSTYLLYPPNVQTAPCLCDCVGFYGGCHARTRCQKYITKRFCSESPTFSDAKHVIAFHFQYYSHDDPSMSISSMAQHRRAKCLHVCKWEDRTKMNSVRKISSAQLPYFSESTTYSNSDPISFPIGRDGFFLTDTDD